MQVFFKQRKLHKFVLELDSRCIGLQMYDEWPGNDGKQRGENVGGDESVVLAESLVQANVVRTRRWLSLQRRTQRFLQLASL